LWVVEPAMYFKIFTLESVDEEYFDLFIIFKMRILKKYGGAEESLHKQSAILGKPWPIFSAL